MRSTRPALLALATAVVTVAVPLLAAAPAHAATATVAVTDLDDLDRGETHDPFLTDVTNSTGADQSDERLDVVLSGLPGLTAAQVTLETGPTAPSGAITYTRVTLRAEGNDLVGQAGPAAGQPLPAGQTRRTPLRIGLSADAPLGTLTVTGEAVAARSGVITGSGAATTTVITEPGAPRISVLSPRDSALSVGVNAPTSTGNSPLTGYRATAVGGGRTVSTDSATPSFVIAGLTNGVSYSVTVRARNRAGLGEASPAVSATPTLPPLALTLTGGPVFVRLGSTVTFSGRVTRGTSPLGGARVTLTVRYVDGQVKPLGVATTRTDGGWSLSTRPLYNGTVTAEVLGATVGVPSRVILTYTGLRSTAAGRSLTVDAATTPGFLTGPGRAERVQLLEVDAAGHQRRVLALVNAGQRQRAPGLAQGRNPIRFRVTLTAGAHRLVVKVIGTPVNTGASSRQLLVRV